MCFVCWLFYFFPLSFCLFFFRLLRFFFFSSHLMTVLLLFGFSIFIVLLLSPPFKFWSTVVFCFFRFSLPFTYDQVASSFVFPSFLIFFMLLFCLPLSSSISVPYVPVRACCVTNESRLIVVPFPPPNSSPLASSRRAITIK